MPFFVTLIRVGRECIFLCESSFPCAIVSDFAPEGISFTAENPLLKELADPLQKITITCRQATVHPVEQFELENAVSIPPPP